MKISLEILKLFEVIRTRNAHVEFIVTGGAQFSVNPAHVVSAVAISSSVTEIVLITDKKGIRVDETFDDVQKKLRGE